jgi:hypothetical protein
MTTENQGGLLMQAYNIVERVPDMLVFPDKSNTGKSIGLFMVWKRISSLTEKKHRLLAESLIEDKLIKDYRKMDVPGTFEMARAGKMRLDVTVSVPRKEFNIDWFCEQMLKQYKVPVAMTKMLFEQAKQPGHTQTKTLKPFEGELEA